MHGLITEREWRKQYLNQSKARPGWWGAQYVLTPQRRCSLKQDRAFLGFLLLLSCTIGLLLPFFCPMKEKESFEEAQAIVVQSAIRPRSVSGISYAVPSQLESREHTFTRAELSRGKMLLLDAKHPLPKDLPPPNTYSIAAAGKGMIPVRSLSIQSGQETIAALQELFAALRQKGVSGLSVHQGTLSAAQQQAIRIDYLRKAMRTFTPDQAVTKTLRETDAPATGEMLQEFTVELRFQQEENVQQMPKLENTQQGQTLLQTAWRYGFVRTDPTGAGAKSARFRYVGKAHAMAMTYLDLSFESYLQWLHEKNILTISKDGEIRYVILCKPMTSDRISFQLPQNAAYEASLDNQGYAIVACTL